ncbi:hypothetical protein DICPUDRAFT_79526 [Dictyostelium purpureum]|uniref:Rab GTPase n=1 Tax=Dictyostelium purpureum TaxID=5786 RepID=F0ZMU9_DICPU|nr:uncharacterized protein DICPUDRAFT_79526 [Dictyostelium purpureum]EGC34736.1 hypothetical protein DICPUDRAFT_79526 [Dictyostelium purpureum]|eukprot:XP_003288736.1 hypothetical protein DICPUDRAFT_79526 [Dictyostelium purpureum]
MEAQLFDYQIKTCIIGNEWCGKSSFLLRFFDQEFYSQSIGTIGVDFKTKRIEMNDFIVRIQLWDQIKTNRFQRNTNYFYRGAYLFFICYDITDLGSFLDVEKVWIPTLERYARADFMVTLIGTKLDKADLYSERKVPYEIAKKYAEEHNMEFYETSSKYDINVNQSVINSTFRVFKSYFENKEIDIAPNINKNNSISNNSNNNNKKKNCKIN